MQLRDINFGDVDAKNEILKQARTSEKTFFESFSIPANIQIEHILDGRRSFILGLKGTGKTALLRYVNDVCKTYGHYSEMILFKSQISEEDRQNLSKSSGFEIIITTNSHLFCARLQRGLEMAYIFSASQ